MSRKGNCWDNAVAASFLGSRKKELIGKQIYKSRDLAKAALTDYIETFYNRSRRHSHLGGVSPEEFEAAHKCPIQGVHCILASPLQRGIELHRHLRQPPARGRGEQRLQHVDHRRVVVPAVSRPRSRWQEVIPQEVRRPDQEEDRGGEVKYPFKEIKMSHRSFMLVPVAVVGVFLATAAAAQQPAAPAPTKTMSQSLGIMVFPAKGQTAEQQATDESGCYGWAKQQTGYDPVAPPPPPAAAPAPAPKGGAVKGAAKGAAGGAAIGAIAGDAGTGAAIGATAGAVKGRRDQKKQAAATQQQAQQSAQAASQAQLDQYKKAFSVCMEGKGYTAK